MCRGKTCDFAKLLIVNLNCQSVMQRSVVDDVLTFGSLSKQDQARARYSICFCDRGILISGVANVGQAVASKSGIVLRYLQLLMYDNGASTYQRSTGSDCDCKGSRTAVIRSARWLRAITKEECMRVDV